jgi:hypothetical protein
VRQARHQRPRHHREHGTIPHLMASHKRAEVSQR